VWFAQVLTTKFLLALVGEFSTSKSAALGLPLEFHRQAHREFEACGLLQVGLGDARRVTWFGIQRLCINGGEGPGCSSSNGRHTESSRPAGCYRWVLSDSR
jgi:hypothetical protein